MKFTEESLPPEGSAERNKILQDFFDKLIASKPASKPPPTRQERWATRVEALRDRRAQFIKKYTSRLHAFNRKLEEAAAMFPEDGPKFRSLIQIDYEDEFGAIFNERITEENIERLEVETRLFLSLGNPWQVDSALTNLLIGAGNEWLTATYKEAFFEHAGLFLWTLAYRVEEVKGIYQEAFLT